MNSKIIGYRPEIDGLRALAVVAVVLNHLKISALPGGFVGVDVFFVISGYLISLILFKENELGYFSIFSFYQRRIKRLFPALLLVLISTLLFGWIALLANEYKMLAGHIKSSVVFLLNFKLMHEIGYFDVATLLKPVLHLWSLSVEEQFYFLWPVALIVATKLRLNIFFFVLLLTVSSMIFCCYLVRVNIDAAYYHPAARFWELLSGVLLAWNHYQNRLIGNHSSTASFNTNLVGMLGLSLICLSMVLIKKDTPYLNIMLLAPNIGAILVLNSNGNSMVVRVLSTPVFVWIGLISYPLYLWHWPIFSYIRIMEFGESNLLLLMGGGGVGARLFYQF